MTETIIYIRTSTTEQNPENQLKDCEAINKWGDYTLYSEQESAFKPDEEKHRDKFNEVLRLIKQKKVSHFIVWDLDRIYRNRKKLINFFKICEIYHCSVHSARQQWLEKINEIPSPFNEMMHEFMLQMMGWMAEEESAHKSQRIKAAIRIRKDGAYSYKGNKWGRKRISTFKRNKILEMRNNNMSIRDIAGELSLSIGVVHKTIAENL